VTLEQVGDERADLVPFDDGGVVMPAATLTPPPP
jgi:hypothetical protein